MKKLLFLIFFCATAAFGAVSKDNVRFDTMSTTDGIVREVRNIIDSINTELASAGGAITNRGTGDIYYVDSAVGSDTNVGTKPEWATATLDAAVDLCTANNGDVIVVIQGHAETIDNGTSDAVDLDLAGITVIGLGYGSDMPELTFDTTTDEIAIDADNVVVYGLRFLAGVSGVLTGFDVKDGADDCAILHCEFPEPTTSSWEFVRAVTITTADRFVFSKNVYRNEDATGATNVVDLDGGVVNGFFAYGNDIYGEFAEGAIHSDDADLEVMIVENYVTNLTTGQHAIEFTAAATGWLIGNHVYTDAEATSIDPGSLKCSQNWVVTAIDSSGVLYPAPDDTTTNYIGVDDADNAATTTNVTANADGSILERLEQLNVLNQLGAGLLGLGTGSVFYVDSGETSGTEDGLTWATATDTLDEAINLTTHDIGDVILIAPGHAETISAADGFDADVNGVTIIGIGRGYDMPTFTYDNAAGEAAIGGDNVTIKNIRFVCSVTGVLIGLDIEANADHALVDGCIFEEAGDASGTDEFNSALRIGNACIGTTIQNCKFRAEAAGAISAIHSDNDTAFTTIQDNVIVGDYSSGCINFITVASTDLHILRNILINGDLVGDNGINAVAAINVVDATGGFVADNRIVSDVASGLLMRVADDMVFMNNYISDTDGDEFSGTKEDDAASIAGHVDG